MNVITIELNEKFFAHHGLYDEEKKLGAWFKIFLEVKYESTLSEYFKLADTIDYTILHNIVKAQMCKPTELLENVCLNIINTIHRQFIFVKQIKVCVEKLHPPVESMHGSFRVCVEKDF